VITTTVHTNEIQVLSIAGNQLSLSNGGGSVNLPAGGGSNYQAGPGISITGTAPNLTINNTGDNDNSATNELQNISLNGMVLRLSVNNRPRLIWRPYWGQAAVTTGQTPATIFLTQIQVMY
jgi:hypothetical protein